ncbi:MAG: tyrosine--tRNA ligase [Candidatus Curtissbacteria bacterium]|nr:tyrosine--tRNA ligase [Candidatus Curtissbacteria bacterium]
MAKVITEENKIKQMLERGVEEVIDKEHLEARLRSGDVLRVKLGIDPTAPDLHLGHTVVLRKLKQFQEAGHKAILIIGDHTAMIGDPSGRNELRPQLTKEQVKRNMKNYLEEAGKVIDIKKAEVRRNSEWYDKKDIAFLLELTSKFTVARVLERDDFQKRIKEDRDIAMPEILYPLLQGYDSVEVKADVELGGTDQKFNLLMGRKVQKRYGLREQDVIMTPLLEGLDGVRKMSKSLGNYIGLSEEPANMFGKVMSIPDDLMIKYFLLLTDVPKERVERLRQDRLRPSLATKPPKEWKEALAVELVKMYHGEKTAEKVRENFERVFSQGKLPEKMPEIKSAGTILQTTVIAGIVNSASEAKRLIEQSAMEINGQTVNRWDQKDKPGDTLKIGSHKFFKLK